MKELKPTTVAVFIYLQPVFATVFYWLRQGWIKSGKNTVGNFDICWCLFGNIPPKALREKNRLHMKNCVLLILHYY
jgi:hypothetical protein